MTINTIVSDIDGGEIQIIEVSTGPAGRAIEVLTGAGAPTNSQGSNGDLYIVTTGDTELGNMYKKANGAWSLSGNLRGPGIESVNGHTGPDVNIVASDIVSGVISTSVLPIGTTENTIASGTHRHDNLYEPLLPTGGTVNHFLRADKSWQVIDKNTVGLSNVNNTSDLLKPISNATQAALDLKANVTHTHNLADAAITGVLPVSKLPIGTTASHVAAGNHTHTPSSIGAASQAEIEASSVNDRNRANHYGTQPASSITGLAQVAITGSAADITTGKLPLEVIPDFAITKVRTVSSELEMLALPAQEGDIAIRSDQERSYVLGPGPANVFTNWKELGSGGRVVSIAGKTGVVVLQKADVGLPNVDNTSDADKPISNATKAALDAKASASHSHDAGQINSGVIDFFRLPVANLGENSSTKIVRANDTRLYDSRTPLPHNHNDLYNTKDQMYVALQGKADLRHTHEIDEIDQLDYALGALGRTVANVGDSATAANNAANNALNYASGLQPQIATAANIANKALADAAAAFGASEAKNKSFYQTSPPMEGMKAGDLWFDTDDENIMYVYGPNGWENVASRISAEVEAAIQLAQNRATEALNEAVTAFNEANTAQEAADAAQLAAQQAQAAAEGSLRTYYQSEPPWPNGSNQPDTVIGDLWFDLDTDVSHRWTGVEWRIIQDDAVSEAIAAAQAAEAAVAAIPKIYVQGNAPVGRTGDLWIDITANANTPKRWNGSAWIAASDKAATDAAASIAALGTRVGTVEGSITTTNNRLATAEGEINAVESRIATAEGNITSTSASVAGLNSTVSSHTTRLNGAEGNITNVTGRVATAESTINTHTTSINGLQTSVTTIQTSKNKVTYSTNPPGATANTKGDLWFRKDGAGQIIGQWEGNGGTSWIQVTLTDAVITNLSAGTITTGQFNADRIAAGSIDTTKIATAGLDAGVIKAGKIDSARIDTEAIRIGPSQVTGLSAELQAAEDAAKAYADSIELGAVNLFDGGRPERGGTSRLVTIPVRNIFAPIVGDEVTISADVKGTASGNLSIFGYQSKGISIDEVIAVPMGITTDWNRFSVTATVKNWGDQSGMSTGEIAFYDTTNANQKISVRNIKIEKGPRATPYSPTQADIDAAIEVAKNAAATAGRTGAVSEMKNIWGMRNNETFIDGGKIFTNSIKATSIALSDWTEYMTGNNWNDPLELLWVLPASFTVDQTVTHEGVPSLKIAGSSTGTATRPTIRVVPGDTYHIEFHVRKDSSWNGSASMSKLRFANANGGAHLFDVTYASADIPTSGTWYKREVNWTVPAGVTDLAVTLNEDASQGTLWLSNISMRRRFGAELIVDGSIETKHIKSTGLNADVIKSGFIDSDRIQAGSIGANKLLVSIGGGNLMDNSSFISDAPRPGNWGNSTITAETGTVWTGTRAVRSTATTNNGGDFGIGFSHIWQEAIGKDKRLKPNTKYVFSIWAYNPSSGGVNHISLGANGAGVASAVSAGPNTIKDDWVRLDCFFTTSSSGVMSVVSNSNGNPGNGKYWILGAHQLEEGEIPTSYRPKAQELLPGTIMANMIDADAIDGKVITGATLQTNKPVAGQPNKGVRFNTTGLMGWNSLGEATFNLSAATGALIIKGKIESGSEIAGATLTGLLRTSENTYEGIKISNSGMVFYAPGSTSVAGALLNYDAAAGTLNIKGKIVSGSEITGPVITLATPDTSFTPVIQTDASTTAGVKINKNGIIAFDSVAGSPTRGQAVFSLSATTGQAAFKGQINSGSTITGSTISGSTLSGGNVIGAHFRTTVAQSGKRIEMDSSSGGQIRYYPETPNVLNPAIIASSGEYTPGTNRNHGYIYLHSPTMWDNNYRAMIQLMTWKDLNTGVNRGVIDSFADGPAGAHTWSTGGIGRMFLQETSGLLVNHYMHVNFDAYVHGTISSGRIALGNGGNSVTSPGIRNTPGGGWQVAIDPNNWIMTCVVSGLQHKVEVEPLELNGRSMLDIVPITYKDRHHVESKAAGDPNWQHEPRRQIGFSAESFLEAGFDELVTLDKNGKPDALAYDRITAVMAVEVKKKFDVLEDTIARLEARIKELEG